MTGRGRYERVQYSYDAGSEVVDLTTHLVDHPDDPLLESNCTIATSCESAYSGKTKSARAVQVLLHREGDQELYEVPVGEVERLVVSAMSGTVELSVVTRDGQKVVAGRGVATLTEVEDAAEEVMRALQAGEHHSVDGSRFNRSAIAIYASAAILSSLFDLEVEELLESE